MFSLRSIATALPLKELLYMWTCAAPENVGDEGGTPF